jgi:segregation and condensation protein A
MPAPVHGLNLGPFSTGNKMTYKVKLNIFEGPLDLLLFLIKKEKLDIYDIPIARITEQYLEYLDILRLLDLDVAGDFLVMAATLLHIKSKMLLPPEEDEDVPEEEMDPREDLVRRLLEYKKFKEVSERLREMHDENKDVYVRKGQGTGARIVSDDGTEYFEANLFDLITSFRKILTRIPKKEFHKVVKNRFSVKDKIHEIYHILTHKKKIRFSELFSKSRDKDEAVVTFLAVLELIKIQDILIVQEEVFSEIEIVRFPGLVKEAETGHGYGNE